ncbi:MAG: dTDP-4-dehydrorhamnose reductase [Desulfovibrionaceae bacterium]
MDLRGKKAVVLGGESGLLGQALMHALDDAGALALGTSRTILDPLDNAALTAFLDREEPDLLFNTVAYTQVDLAEEEPDQAMRVNAGLPKRLGRLSEEQGFQLIQYSTDFVFDGRKEGFYTEEDEPCPLSVYGKTKLQGERALLGNPAPGLLVIRTAWLFGPGRSNFVHKILKMACEKESLSIVHDQIGSPTYTVDLAKHSLQLIGAGAVGLYHVTNGGRASWCELAAEAISVAGLDCRVEAIPSSAYPAKATRPANSLLDNAKFTAATGVTPRPWAQALREYVYTDMATKCVAD